MSLEADVLAGLLPTEAEQSEMDARVEHLVAACHDAMAAAGLQGLATVQGSVAKGTWLAGNTDIDCFLLLDPATPDETLKEAAEAVGERILTDPRRKYAQHPYLMGQYQGADVDLVPAYQVTDPGQKMSAVDRTPFHTAWVTEHLDENARNQVRLLKQWCKGVGIYGAETAIGGFSGYLLEVLVAVHGSFQGVLAWFSAGCSPARLAVGDDQVNDKVSPLVVVDPVDATRNCAAAVQTHRLAIAQEAADAYAEAPGPKFFHPAPANHEPRDALEAAMQQRGETWIGLVAQPQTDRLDIVFPQFQKAARAVASELKRAGFHVRRQQVDAFDEDTHVGLQWVIETIQLPAERQHRGPSPDKEPNATIFREKWDNHPDAIGPAQDVDGRLQVAVRTRHRTGPEWLQDQLPRIAFGKHVTAAIAGNPNLVTDPSHVPPGWAATVTEHVLDRRPWQR